MYVFLYLISNDQYIYFYRRNALLTFYLLLRFVPLKFATQCVTDLEFSTQRVENCSKPLLKVSDRYWRSPTLRSLYTSPVGEYAQVKRKLISIEIKLPVYACGTIIFEP